MYIASFPFFFFLFLAGNGGALSAINLTAVWRSSSATDRVSSASMVRIMVSMRFVSRLYTSSDAMELAVAVAIKKLSIEIGTSSSEATEFAVAHTSGSWPPLALSFIKTMALW